MEEKERYEIHIYDDCNVDLYDNGVLDRSITDTWKLEKLLNQQDKQIKELEEENGYIVFADGYDKNSNEIHNQKYVTYKSKCDELTKENKQLKKQVEELKGKRLEFYNDDVRRTQVINGVHFDIEQLLVFSEYVEHERNIMADKDKKINQLNQQLHDLPKKIVGDIRTDFLYGIDGETTGIDIILDTILKKYGGENESK